MRMVIKSPLATMLLVRAAVAPAASQHGADDTLSVRDPDQKVCEDITIVCSRLAVKRVCATRAQWEDKRRGDRECTDQAQKSPCVVTSVQAGHQIC